MGIRLQAVLNLKYKMNIGPNKAQILKIGIIARVLRRDFVSSENKLSGGLAGSFLATVNPLVPFKAARMLLTLLSLRRSTGDSSPIAIVETR